MEEMVAFPYLKKKREILWIFPHNLLLHVTYNLHSASNSLFLPYLVVWSVCESKRHRHTQKDREHAMLFILFTRSFIISIIIFFLFLPLLANPSGRAV
jgi:hypothetical protein